MVKLRNFDEETKRKINWCAKCRYDRNNDKRVCEQLKVYVKDKNGRVVEQYYDMTRCNTPDNSIQPNRFVPKNRRRKRANRTGRGRSNS